MWTNVHSLFHVLNLLSSLLNLSLHREAQFGNARTFAADAACFGEQRVCLTVHFLEQKVKLLAHFSACRKQFPEVTDMGRHTRQFFGDVAAIYEHGDLFKQPLPVELISRSCDQPLREPLLVTLFNL